MHLPANLLSLAVLILMMPLQDVCLHMTPVRVSVRICCVCGTNIHGPGTSSSCTVGMIPGHCLFHDTIGSG